MPLRTLPKHTDKFEISLANEQSAHAVDAELLIFAARAVLAESKFDSARLSLAVVDDATIHELNRRHLNHDWPTDVLSFVLEDRDDHLEGEVILSADTAAVAAQEIGWPAAAEQTLYVIHGVLHLVGYLDKTDSDAQQMRAAERAILARFGFASPVAARSYGPVNLDALFWIAIASAAAASLTSLAAKSLRDFSRRDLEGLCERRQRLDRFEDILHHHERIALSAEMLAMVLLTLALVCITVWCSQYFSLANRPSAWQTLAAFTAATGFLLILAIVCLPWSISRVAAAQFLYHTWPVWSMLGRAFYPLVWLARALDAVLHRVTGRKNAAADEETLEEEIRTIVSEGHREGLIEEDARGMIEGVIELRGAVVSHIMTPRTEMHMLPASTPWDEVVESVIESGHTRVPVYDKTRDDVIGILYSKDLLPELAKSPDEPRRPLTALLRKPQFVPETKAVDDLLQWFQKSRTHMAVVLDEYGGVSGLVTIEDVLEEIVGEIDDEYDQESEDKIRKIDDDVCEALGQAHIDKINEFMGFDLPEEEDFDTIGGFVFAEFGRVPSVGESITWQDAVRVTVLEASRRRVNRVRLERVRKESLEIA